jgi:Flp pilus assembly protein TadG
MGDLAARESRSRQRGQVLVLFLLSLTALMAAAGLAIDMGRFYAERRFLQNTADAAALAGGTVLARGGTNTEARAEIIAVLQRNYTNPPNGITPSLPPAQGSEVYESGHAGDRWYLVDGIVISSHSVRVAIRNTIPFTVGRAVGLDDTVVYARARARFQGDLLPIAVRRFTHAPGASTGVAPCVDDFSTFTDFFATANTSCLGTDSTPSSRTIPNPGAAFSSANPDNDRANHGPIVPILGQGADPDNGADFRGFVALDIRNFQSASSQIYYNGVSGSTNANTLKDMETQWIIDGGYPGPLFPPAVVPPDPANQVAIMSGNSAGQAVDAMAQRFAPGDEILVAVYSGMTMQIPDFSMSSPGTISVPETGTVAIAGSFRVGRNQAFSGQVTLSTPADLNDPANPMVLGTLLGAPDPVDFDPNPVTPSLGAGVLVDMEDVQTAGATPGVYAMWLKGVAGSPYLTTKYTPFALRVGTVSRDFTMTADAVEKTTAGVGGTITFTLNLKRSGSAFGGTGVALSLEGMPGGSLPAGIGTVTFSPATVTPASGSGANSTLTINTGTMAPGIHELVVRATGTNGDATPRQVTHLLPLRIGVGASATSGNQEYVDILGFSVMRVATMDANAITAYAITPVIADITSPQLRRGQATRLVPWDY